MVKHCTRTLQSRFISFRLVSGISIIFSIQGSIIPTPSFKDVSHTLEKNIHEAEFEPHATLSISRGLTTKRADGQNEV